MKKIMVAVCLLAMVFVLTALMSIMAWLAPDSWERGWNADIPMECIYIAW